MEIMDKKIKDAIVNKVLIEMDKKSLRWCNQYRLVPKSNGNYRLVVDIFQDKKFMKPIHFKIKNTPTLKQLLMKNNFAISYNLKEAYNHVPVHPKMQGLLGLQYQGRLYKYQGMPFGLNEAPRVFTQIMKKAIHTIREIWRVCCLIYLDDLLVLHQKPTSIERNRSPDNPILSTSRMDCQFRKVEPNSVKSIQIPGLDVEYLKHVSTTSRREKIQYPSRVEEINEENKIQKMYFSQSTSQTDRKTISYSNPIYTSLTIPQTTIGLSEYQSQQRRMGHICSMGIQNDWGNQMVDENYKNQQTSSYFKQPNLSNSDNNGYFPDSKGGNFPSNKSKCRDKSKKRNGEIIPRRKESCDPIGKRKVILPHKFNEYQVELYGSVRSETESEASERISNSPKEMVKLYEKTDFKPERDNSDLPSTSSFSTSNKEIQIQEDTNKKGQYCSDAQHQQEIRYRTYTTQQGRYGNYQRETN
jgi:hypothetical protein